MGKSIKGSMKTTNSLPSILWHYTELPIRTSFDQTAFVNIKDATPFFGIAPLPVIHRLFLEVTHHLNWELYNSIQVHHKIQNVIFCHSYHNG